MRDIRAPRFTGETSCRCTRSRGDSVKRETFEGIAVERFYNAHRPRVSAGIRPHPLEHLSEGITMSRNGQEWPRIPRGSKCHSLASTHCGCFRSVRTSRAQICDGEIALPRATQLLFRSIRAHQFQHMSTRERSRCDSHSGTDRGWKLERKMRTNRQKKREQRCENHHLVRDGEARRGNCRSHQGSCDKQGMRRRAATKAPKRQRLELARKGSHGSGGVG